MILLRPWFLFIAFIPLIFWIFKKRLSAQNPLENFVDKRLLPFLTVHFNIGLYRLKMKWFVFFWTLLTIAGSGPAFDKISVPATTQAPADVIVLDLSPAMTPENLTKAKLKLYDLLNALKGHQVGLVLYDEKGYTASPLTQDIEVIRNMIPALSPSVMPRPNNLPQSGFQQAINLLQNARMNTGQIIFITAGGFDNSGLEEITKNIPYTVMTLAIETPDEGYPVPIAGGDFMRHTDGTPILVKPNKAELSKIGTYIPMSVLDDDIKTIQKQNSQNISSTSKAQEEITERATIWKDLGPYLLFFAIPFFIWLFRKGVFFCLFIFLPFTVQAGLFERPDQENYRQTMSGVNAYRIGNYEVAKQVFEAGKSANDFYNAGNAKAYLNDIQGAIQSYKKALEINPEHTEAKWNKEYLEKQLPPQQNQEPQEKQQNPEEQKQQSQDNQQNESEQNEQPQQNEIPPNDQQDVQEQEQEQEQGQGQEQNQQQSSTQLDKQRSENTAQKLESQSETEPQNENEQASPVEEIENKNQEQPQNESLQEILPNNKQFDQESEQLLNKIKQDPSRLLRYRLYQQYIRKSQ